MSENVTLFPNILQPATAMKAYAPIGVKFWENQETALEGWKEFADAWFARRQESAQAALEAAKHIGDADTPSDACRGRQGLSAASAEGRCPTERTAGRATDRRASRKLARPRYPPTSLLIPRQFPASSMTGSGWQRVRLVPLTQVGWFFC